MYRTKFFDHLILIAGVIFMLGPLVVAFTTSTHSAAEIHSSGLTLTVGDHLTETYGNVTPEALASGLALLAFDYAAAAELVRHGDNGWIAAGGSLPFWKFMELALYAPGLGYYSAGAIKFGRGGDFVTAPELSPLFAACVADALTPVLQQLGPEAQFMEIGGGSGAFTMRGAGFPPQAATAGSLQYSRPAVFHGRHRFNPTRGDADDPGWRHVARRHPE